MESGSKLDVTHAEIAFRTKVFKSALVFVFIAATIFTYNNWMVGSQKYAMLQAALAVFCLSLLKVSVTSKKYYPLCLTFVLFFAVVVCVGAATVSFKSGLYVWLFVFPLMSYLLLGVHRGVSLTVLYLIFGVTICLWRMSQGDDSIHPIAIANFVLSFVLVWAMAHTYETQRKKALRELLKLASTDPLTGLKNRLDLENDFEALLTDHINRDESLCLMVIDIDYFKKLNDQYGHDVGDRVLTGFAKVLSKSIRSSDIAFRVGGEEFCVLLPSCEMKAAIQSAERIRLAASNYKLNQKNQNINITVSIGVASFPSDAESFDGLFRRADQRLYQAKEAGRNQVISG